jgi:hypothetical protein
MIMMMTTTADDEDDDDEVEKLNEAESADSLLF